MKSTDNICRYCNKAGATMVTLSYWNQIRAICHAECKITGELQEAIDCQIIDADCNDCRHFIRGKLVKRLLSAMVNGKSAMVPFNFGIVMGHCMKFNQPTEAYPHMSTGRECFEHRRTV